MDNKLLHKRKRYQHVVFFNLIFWGLSFLVLSFVFSNYAVPTSIDYLYSLIFISTLIPAVSINLYWLFPSFLVKKRYLLFGLLWAIDVGLFSNLNLLFFDSFTHYLFSDYYFVSAYSIGKTCLVFVGFIILSTLLKMADDWFYWQSYKYKLLQQEKHKIQQDLSALRSQINPHFLFNSLNTIYALSQDNASQTQQAILQLSNVLRYVIYEPLNVLIDWNKEYSVIKDYIDFQRNKYKANSISIDVNQDREDYKIYPMLLLPLLENAFKHGLNDDTADNFLNIKIELKKGQLQVQISNNYKHNKVSKASKGIGLQILKKQLETLYPHRHQININHQEPLFQVDLFCELN